MVLTSQFSEMTSSLFFFFDVVLFVLSTLVTGPIFMSLSSLVLELWQFPFIRNLPEIRKLKIAPSEFCPICGDWCELRIPNLARTSLIKCYRMLENARVTAFTVSVLLRENQHEWAKTKLPYPPPPNGLGLKAYRAVVQI